MSDAKKRFLQKVTHHIRSKEAKQYVEKELTYHIEEQKSYLTSQGYSDEKAELMAVNQMGDPGSIGREMHKIHKPKVDWVLAGLFVLVLAAGIITFYYLTPIYAATNMYFLVRRVDAALLSVLVIIIFMLIDYRKLEKWWPLLSALGLFLSVWMLQSDYYIGGAAYLRIGSFTLSIWPISLLFIFSYAAMLSSLKGKRLWIMATAMLWVPLVIFQAIPQLPLTLFYFLTAMTITAFAPLPKRAIKQFIITNTTVIMFFTTIAVTLGQGMRMRLSAFINPEADLNGAGYIPSLLRQITSQAAWVGQGPSTEVTTNLPEWHTDLILASIIGQLGWVPAFTIIFILSLFMSRMIITIKKSRHPLGNMIIVSGVSMVGFSVIWNIAMVLGWVPVIGVSLPFISYAFGYQLIYSVFIGMILSVYRRKDLVQPEAIEKPS